MIALISDGLLWLVKQIGLPAVIIAGGLFYYEGCPFLSGVPFVDRIPVVGNLVLGRVEIERRAAAKEARDSCATLFELTAARVEAAELRRQLDISTRLADEAQDEAATATAEANAARKALEARLAQDSDPDDSLWTDHDLDRLRIDRGR